MENRAIVSREEGRVEPGGTWMLLRIGHINETAEGTCLSLDKGQNRGHASP